jgi:hypothetical protein
VYWRDIWGPRPVGPLLVRALMLTAVERLHAAGYGKMYDGRPQTAAQVPNTPLRVSRADLALAPRGLCRLPDSDWPVPGARRLPTCSSRWWP